jgi:hypothetical protein
VNVRRKMQAPAGLAAMRWLRAAAIVCALAVTGTLTITSPAHAETIRQYENDWFGGCMDSSGQGRQQAHAVGCNSGAFQKWRVQTISTTETPQELVFLRNVASADYCLDSHGTGDQDVMMIRCNGGVYQMWEVFRVGEDRVFKSWGSWKQGRTHKCIWEDGTWNGQPLQMRDCDLGDRGQQWSVVS